LQIEGNIINDTDDDGITVDVRGAALSQAGGTAHVTIRNNQLGNLVPVSSRAKFEGLRVRLRDNPKTMNLLFENNFVRSNGNSVGDETVDVKCESSGCVLNATILGNTLKNDDSGATPASPFTCRTLAAGAVICLDLRNNTAVAGTNLAALEYDLQAFAGSTFNLEGAGGAAVTPANIQAANPAGSGVAGILGTITFNGGANCPMPNLPVIP
jgi:hypothetical protein